MKMIAQSESLSAALCERDIHSIEEPTSIQRKVYRRQRRKQLVEANLIPFSLKTNAAIIHQTPFPIYSATASKIA
jgi:hypothetical protein